MEKLTQLLQSYLTLYEVVTDRYIITLRQDKSIGRDIIPEQRKTKPASYSVDEIKRLAIQLNIGYSAALLIPHLAMYLRLLPPEQLDKLLRVANLDIRKLRRREQNYNAWKLEDLRRLYEACIKIG